MFTVLLIVALNTWGLFVSFISTWTDTKTCTDLQHFQENTKDIKSIVAYMSKKKKGKCVTLNVVSVTKPRSSEAII